MMLKVRRGGQKRENKNPHDRLNVRKGFPYLHSCNGGPGVSGKTYDLFITQSIEEGICSVEIHGGLKQVTFVGDGVAR